MSTSLRQLLEDDAGRDAVPPAPIEDVLSGGRSRVRRRRVLGVAAAVVLALLAIAIPFGLTGGDSDNEPIEHPERSDSLTFTREDGTTFTLGGARVACPPPSLTETESQVIVVRSPSPGSRPMPGYFVIEAPLDEVADGATIELPASLEHVFEGSAFGEAYFFAYDAEDTNELATNTEGASGTLVFESASCEPSPAIDVRIDATMASEAFDGQPVRVDGRITLGYGD
jgi:hypothetical protein